ncbi:MAG: hypothetical protein ACM3U0_02180 [archaeon]
MKIFFCTLIFCFAALSGFSNAQEYTINKGLYRISGTVGLSYDKQHEEDSDFSYTMFNAYISPGFSYLFTDNLELGINLSYQYIQQKVEEPDLRWNRETFYSTVMAGVAARYYFTNSGIIPFVHSSFLYSAEGFQGSRKTELKILNVGGGINYFLSNSVAVEPTINYRFVFGYKDVSVSQLTIGAGINYFIRK